MSKHSTLTSKVSDMLSQQQLNLQQLNNLQQHGATRSMTSNYNQYLNDQQAQPQQQQQNYPSDTTVQNSQDIPSIQASGSNNHNKFNSLTSTSMQSGQQQKPMMRNTNTQQNPRSPLVIMLPTSAQPTEVLAARFTAWRNVIRSIIVYLSETASIQDEIVRQQLRLNQAVHFPFFSVENQYQPSSTEDKTTQKFFTPLGNGSIQDLPTILMQYHGSLATQASRASRELTGEVIPRLEDLRHDLVVKIKEIKSLHSDFKNSCSKELHQTKLDLQKFQESIEDANYGSAKQDPYLTKLALDKQIRKQLAEENFLHEAFDNLENSGAELEKVVVMEIQNALTIYARLLGQNAQLVFDVLISKLDAGFFSKNPQFEWENFIAKDPNFISPNLPVRKIDQITYRNQADPLVYKIRDGFLDRRSKYLKSYSKGFFVLTPSFLHEFKTPDRKKDLVPIMSLALSECTVAEHSKKSASDFKFILHAKQNGIIHRGQNWVLRADSYETMMAWYNDIKQLTSLSNNLKKKYDFLAKRLQLDNENETTINDGDTSNQNVHPSNASINNPNEDSLTMFPPILDTQTNTITTISSIPDTTAYHLGSNGMDNISNSNAPESYLK